MHIEITQNIKPIEAHRIIYEDNHLIAINKLCGEICQSDKTHDITLQQKIAAFIKIRDNKKGRVFIGVIHRLDRPTSGCIMYAKTSKILSRMNTLFRTNMIQKYYIAIVHPIPQKHINDLKHYLLKDTTKNISCAYITEKNNTKYAHLHYELCAQIHNYGLLFITLITGRHHQIRAQLKALSPPIYIYNDRKYGATHVSTHLEKEIGLHAYQIAFIHPITNKNCLITAHPLSHNALWHKLLAIAQFPLYPIN